MMKDIRLEMTCPFCGATHTVDCREEQYNRYCNGELAQVAFDDLNATEREQIISHICPKCQSDIFGDDEDDYFDEKQSEKVLDKRLLMQYNKPRK